MTLREYQKRPTAKAIDFFNNKNLTAPKAMVFPTGWGKSHLIAHVVKEVGGMFLIIQPSKELLEQNYGKYVALGEEASIYSASLGKKHLSDVTFATIGSIKKLGKVFRDRGTVNVIVDECDRYPQVEGMLPSFLEDLGSKKVLGITATPIKLKPGRYGSTTVSITSGFKNDRFYDDLIHVSQVSEMVEGGWWSELTYDIRDIENSMLSWNTTGAEYSEDSLEKFYFDNKMEDKIINAIEEYSDRSSWLIFVPSIDNANSLSSKLEGFEVISSKTKKSERTKRIKEYKEGKLKGLISINALSVGFDHPRMDGIICARPTGSITWYIQALGRGVRTHEEKKDCVIVDFSGNCRNFGPIEEMFYSKNSDWHLYGKGGKRLTGFISRDAYGAVKTPQGVKMKKNNIMPFGKHKGVRLKNLPPRYIVYLVENNYAIQDVSVKAELEVLYQQYKYI